jgi:maltose-binding protein MalE
LIASLVYYSEDKIYDQILHAKNEDALPDIVFLNPETMSGLAQLGILSDLESEDWSQGLASIEELQLNENKTAGMIGGIRYGIPTEASVQVLMYNPDLFSNIGGVPPSDTSSFWKAIDAVYTNYRASSSYGHTWIVTAVEVVEGKVMISTIDTYNTLSGKTKITNTGTYEWNPNDGTVFVYVGDYLK